DELDVPQPGTGEALVRVHAAGITPRVRPMATPSHFDNILSRDDWLAILRCVGAEQERLDEETGRLDPEHPRHAATEQARHDLAALRAKLHRLIEELGHAVT